MKRIINGKKYDTETAKVVINCESNFAKSSPIYFCRKLYQKTTGEFFEWFYNSSGDDKITPLSNSEVKLWVEINANMRYEELFGEVEE